MIGEFVFVFLVSILAGIVVYFVMLRVSQQPDHFLLRALRDQQGLARWRRVADALFLFAATGCAISLLLFVFLRYYNFKLGAPDLGLFDQVIWNSLHGRLFESSLLAAALRNTYQGPPLILNPDGTLPVANQLGNHFAPLLLMLVPLYVVVPDPRVLMTVLVLMIVGVGFPLYWYARAQVGHLLGLVVAVAFFMSPLLPGIVVYDFHEVSLTALPLALALFFLLRRRDVPFLICVLLALLIKEDVAFIVAELGLFIVVIQRRYSLGLTILLLGLIWGLVVVQWIIPLFHPYGGWLGFLYPAFGRNFLEMAQTIVTQPLFVVQYILELRRIEFLLHLFAPLAFVSFVGVEIAILTFVPILVLVLSAHEALYRPFSYYVSSMLPFLFFSTVLGIQRIVCWGIERTRASAVPELPWRAALAALILSASGLTFYLYSPLPPARSFNLNDFLPNPRSDLGHALLAKIPADMHLAVPDNFFAHVSRRKFVYMFPSFPDYRQIEYLFADAKGFWYHAHKSAWDEVLETGYYEIEWVDSYLIARRRPLDHSLYIQYADQISLLGYTLDRTWWRGGQTLRPIMDWRADRTIKNRYVFCVKLIDEQGYVWAQDEREPREGTLPTDRWVVGKTIGDQFRLRLSSVMPPGDYQIVVGVFDPQSAQWLPARAPNGQVLGETPSIVTVRIEKDTSNITATQLHLQGELEQLFFVDMQEIRLIGFKPIPQTIAAGQTLPIGVYWRAREKPRGDYLVSVQLRDAAGRVVAEHKDRPARGAYPTTQWVQGEVLLDWHNVLIPATLAPGVYTVHVVLTKANGERLGIAELAAIAIAEP